MPSSNFAAAIEDHRNYLRILADAQISGILQPKLDASDIVQQTLIKATEAEPQFRNEHPGAMAGWLGQILNNQIADAYRHFACDKRDARRELSAVTADSSHATLQGLAASLTSPSVRMRQSEQAIKLANAIAQLPVDQQQAVVLRHLQSLSLHKIASRMNKTEPAVAGLLRRGLAALKETMNSLAEA